MKIQLTRNFVVRTLRREIPERLHGGTYLRDYDAITGLSIPPKDCFRCAVGALMLGVADDPKNLQKVRDAISTEIYQESPDVMCVPDGLATSTALRIASQSANANPLRALSLFFETKWSGGLRGKKLLNATVSWAEEHLPDKFEIDIDGMKPRKVQGVVVVKKRRKTS